MTEVTVAASLFVAMLAVVLVVVVTQGKVGISIGNYSDLNASSRMMLTRFEQDVRMANSVSFSSDVGLASREFIITPANAINWANLKNSTGTIVAAHNGAGIRYFYSSADQKLYRQYPATKLGDGVDANCTVVLSNLSSCSFFYFNADDAPPPANDATSVDKIIFSGVMKRTFTGITNTENTVSAAVVLRGKPGSRL